jgi:hypothetical protein
MTGFAQLVMGLQVPDWKVLWLNKIVTQRLRLPGAQWQVAEVQFKPPKRRAAWLSGYWQTLYDRRLVLLLAI